MSKFLHRVDNLLTDNYYNYIKRVCLFGNTPEFTMFL